MPDRSPITPVFSRPLARVVVGVLAGAVILAGCGSSSTTTASSATSAATSTTTTAGSTTTAAGVSPPAYCQDVKNFKNAVAQLKDTGSLSAIISSITKVTTTGQAAISAVKTALGPVTGALKSVLTTLQNSIAQLTNSDTRASALHQLPAEVTAVKTSAANFVNAAKCG
jgi:hypothetical protein